MALTKVDPKSTTTISAGFDAVNTIIDDLASVAANKGASCIGVKDTADNMAATEVESALAEIYVDTASAITLANVLNENADTTTGLTWGYIGGNIRLDNTITTIATGTISLTNTAVNYIEVNTSGVVSRNTTGFTSGKIPIRQVTCAGGLQTVSTDKRAWFQAQLVPLTVALGGTGAPTLTDGGLLVGSGTGAITALGVATNGQIPIGDGATDPVLATLTGTANEITVTNGAGSITLSLPANNKLMPEGCIIAWIGGYFQDGSNGTYTRVLGTANTVAAVNTLLNAFGWYVCSGAALNLATSTIFNGASRYLPNLTDDRFIEGDTTCGAIGGSSTMAHTHGVTTNVAVGAHSNHTALALNTEATHTHAAGSFVVNDAHTHALGSGTGGAEGLGAATPGYYTDSKGSATTAVTGTSAVGAAHTHTFSQDITAHSAHSVTNNAVTSDAASNTENRPLFLTAFYLMKVW